MPHKRKQSKGRNNKQKVSQGINISDFLVSNSKPSATEVKKTKEKQNSSTATEASCSKDINTDKTNVLLRYQDAVVYRSILELALFNLLVKDSGDKKVNMSKANATDHETANQQVSAGNANAGANSGASLSKIISPMQDLGRSLFGFLTGSGQNISEQGSTATATGNTLQKQASGKLDKSESLRSNSSGTEVQSA